MKLAMVAFIIGLTGTSLATDVWSDVIGTVTSQSRVDEYHVEILTTVYNVWEDYGNPYYIHAVSGTFDIMCTCYYDGDSVWADTEEDVYLAPYDTTRVDFTEP